MDSCPLLELCKCSEIQICQFCIQLTIVIMAILLGIWLLWQPKRTIKMQVAFYRLINWKVEPISMAKEIRNTRIMGVAILIFAIISLLYVIVR